MQWTAIYIWMDHAVLTVTMHQRDAGFCSFHRCNRKDLICQFCNIKCLVCKLDPARINLAKLQYIID